MGCTVGGCEGCYRQICDCGDTQKHQTLHVEGKAVRTPIGIWICETCFAKLVEWIYQEKSEGKP